MTSAPALAARSETAASEPRVRRKMGLVLPKASQVHLYGGQHLGTALSLEEVSLGVAALSLLLRLSQELEPRKMPWSGLSPVPAAQALRGEITKDR